MNDDGSGFLTPDVVNPESEGEEEEGEGEDEYEENYEDLEAKEAETEEFDENDHLFNRLRSYTQHKSFVCSRISNLLYDSRATLGVFCSARPAYGLCC